MLQELADDVKSKEPAAQSLPGGGTMNATIYHSLMAIPQGNDWKISFVVTIVTDAGTSTLTWTFLLGDIDWHIQRTKVVHDTSQQTFHVLTLKCSGQKANIRFDRQSEGEVKIPATNDRFNQMTIEFLDVDQAIDIQKRLSKILMPSS